MIEKEPKLEEPKISKRARRTIELAKILEERGIKDVLILKPETARKVLTKRRRELIRTLKGKKIGSIQELSKEVNRKIEAVHRDLKLLEANGIIRFEQKGRKKIPILTAKNILPSPLILEKPKKIQV